MEPVTASVVRATGWALGPLDRLRTALYRLGAPVLGPWVRHREVRIAVGGGLVALTSLAMAVGAPLVQLAVGPVVLGIPHLVADVRYLVTRPGLHRLRGAPIVGLLLGATAVTGTLTYGIVGAALVALFGERRNWLAAPLAGLALASAWWPWPSAVVAAHVHNVVAVVLWLTLARPRLDSPTAWAVRLAPVVAIVAGAAAIGLGAFDGWLARTATLTLPGALELGIHQAILAPGLPPESALRWVVLFAFGQAVHYGLWLRIVPEEARHRPAPRTLRVAWSVLQRDIGAAGLALAVVATLVIATWAVVDLSAARGGYLTLAAFHGPMELVALAWLWTRKGSP